MTDREWDRRLGVQTAGREDERGGRCMPYEPTPYAVLERLAAQGGLKRADHLLDVGCGKGRVAFFLAEAVGCRVMGIDHSEKLIAMAEANRARFAYPDRVRFLWERAERLDPGDATAAFFFNPFSERVLGGVLRRLAGARRRLFFYYPVDNYLDCLAAWPGLTRAGEIDCRDLFDGENPRERILIYDMTED